MTRNVAATRRRLLGAAVGIAVVSPAAWPAFAATPLPERALGAADAPVTMIEYASLTCPHCAAFHNETLPGLRERYIDPGRVRLVFRDFPLDRLALQAAQLAHAAGEARYFAMLSALFSQQESWATAEDPVAALKQLAQLGGMSGTEVDAALADEALRDAILQVRLEGEQQHDIRSTPSFLLGGKVVRGDQGVDGFAELIDGLLG